MISTSGDMRVLNQTTKMIRNKCKPQHFFTEYFLLLSFNNFFERQFAPKFICRTENPRSKFFNFKIFLLLLQQILCPLTLISLMAITAKLIIYLVNIYEKKKNSIDFQTLRSGPGEIRDTMGP